MSSPLKIERRMDNDVQTDEELQKCGLEVCLIELSQGIEDYQKNGKKILVNHKKR